MHTFLTMIPDAIHVSRAGTVQIRLEDASTFGRMGETTITGDAAVVALGIFTKDAAQMAVEILRVLDPEDRAAALARL